MCSVILINVSQLTVKSSLCFIVYLSLLNALDKWFFHFRLSLCL